MLSLFFLLLLLLLLLSFSHFTSAGQILSAPSSPSRISRRRREGPSSREQIQELHDTFTHTDNQFHALHDWSDASDVPYERRTRLASYSSFRAPALTDNMFKRFSDSWTKKDGPVQRQQYVPPPKGSMEESTDHRRCTICMEDYRKGDFIDVWPCGHQLHSECSQNYQKSCANGFLCPICRHPIPEQFRLEQLPSVVQERLFDQMDSDYAMALQMQENWNDGIDNFNPSEALRSQSETVDAFLNANQLNAEVARRNIRRKLEIPPVPFDLIAPLESKRKEVDEEFQMTPKSDYVKVVELELKLSQLNNQITVRKHFYLMDSNSIFYEDQFSRFFPSPGDSERKAHHLVKRSIRHLRRVYDHVIKLYELQQKVLSKRLSAIPFMSKWGKAVRCRLGRVRDKWIRARLNWQRFNLVVAHASLNRALHKYRELVLDSMTSS